MAQSSNSAPSPVQPLGLTETLRRTPVGSTVYLTADSPAISACAASAGIKVTTARLLAIHPASKAVTDLTAVTIVSSSAPLPGARTDGAVQRARRVGVVQRGARVS